MPQGVLDDVEVDCFVPLDPAAPWHQYVVVPGAVVKPLASTSYLVWRSSRDNDGDLGHVLRRVRLAFPDPAMIRR